MRRYDERGACAARFVQEKLGDRAFECGVEVSRGFVRENDARPSDESARDGNALAFAVGKRLDRAVILVGEADARKQFTRVRGGGGVERERTVKTQRQQHIREHIERPDEFEGLEHLPAAGGAIGAARGLAFGGDLAACRKHAARPGKELARK